MENVFNEKNIDKKIYDDRWVRFAFGPQGVINIKTLNCGITRFDKDKISQTHKHPVDEALYVLEGNGDIRLGKNTHPVKDGDFIFIPAGTDHTIITGSSGKLKIFFIFS
ncbi:MAG: cupin domain-containing protein, partial [Actinobacteria bacterium]|nr:cupin domain-containing protein [Actinomycetota bacterium]